MQFPSAAPGTRDLAVGTTAEGHPEAVYVLLERQCISKRTQRFQVRVTVEAYRWRWAGCL